MPGKIGLIAGGGTIPSTVVKTALQQGRDIYVAAFAGITDLSSILSAKDNVYSEHNKYNRNDIPEAAFSYEVFKLGQGGKMLKAFKREKVEEIVFIGYIRRPSFKEISLDFWTAKQIAKFGFSISGDDSLLSRIIKLTENEGFKVIGVQDIVPELLAVKGVYGKIQPDKRAAADIEIGYKIAKGLGTFDIGQSVIVQQGMIIGVEAIEGTDALIKRCKDLQRKGVGGVLVKTCKPTQEKRIDLPTIGVGTIENAAASGLRGVAIEAGSALVVNVDDIIQKANKSGLFVVGI